MAIILTTALTSASHAETAAFTADTVGAAPVGWTLTKTGRGESRWTVETDASAPSKGKVLKQSGTATYPLALKTGSAVRDGFAEVTFKALAGKEDRAAGLVWRAKDADNYYVVRANALEDNVVLYKTVGGKRIELNTVKGDTYGLKAPVPPNQWHTLRVEFAGTRFKVIYNGKPLFEVDDATFKDAGMAGLWTKADSVTVFDSFSFGAAN
jgi:hypothetical protein